MGLVFHSLGHFTTICINFLFRTARDERHENEADDDKEVYNTNGENDIGESLSSHVPAFGQGYAPNLHDGEENNEHDEQDNAECYEFDIFHCLYCY